MKYVVLMLVVLAVASAAPARDKRFLLDTIQAIGNIFVGLFNTAKTEFDHLIHGQSIDFHSVVQNLVPLINSDMTKGACSAVCSAAAGVVLEGAASMAGTLCGPVCDGALATVSHVAG